MNKLIHVCHIYTKKKKKELLQNSGGSAECFKCDLASGFITYSCCIMGQSISRSLRE
ncbi:hypothetical protein WN51_01331 [Melipona quadrifasciata]|uniref:Uncharacterized protein n=1 Tax=Melipona quadrifasciata TaxID=166423 RepID=A0A0N0U504_9HYME|nr:hypothetical protein WN51_01331 [Melipona quadrifasciata]